MNEDLTQNEAQEIVNELAEKFANSKLNGVQILSSLTDKELTAYIAIKTMVFGGRSWAKSIENALHHLENRDRAVNLFGRRQFRS